MCDCFVFGVTDILEMLNGMTPMIANNLKHKKKSDFRSGALPCKELEFFADVKHKVVKTHGHIYDYSTKSYGNFSKVRAYLLCLKTFEFVCETESFLHKSSCDVSTTVLVQLNVI